MSRQPETPENGAGEAAGDDLGAELSQISAAALTLALAAVENGDFTAGRAEAQGLSDRLGALWPRVESAPETGRAALERDWSDARLDLGYLLSDGELTPSIRLHRARQDRETS